MASASTSVQQLLDRGANKVYAAVRDPGLFELTDPRVVPVALDVTDPGSIQAARSVASDVTVLVNNAGIAIPTPVLSADATDLRRQLEVNLFGPVAMATAFLDKVEEVHVVIVNSASVVAWFGLGGSYGVS